MSRPTLSLVLPIYNEEEIIPELGRRLTAFFDDLDSENLTASPGARLYSLAAFFLNSTKPGRLHIPVGEGIA